MDCTVKRAIFICFATVCLFALETESKPLFGVNREGWHFFNEEKTSDINDTVQAPKDEELAKLSAEEFSRLLDSVKSIAVMNPTEHNVREYIRIQNFATKQSELFMQTWMRVQLEDSSLDLSAAIPKGAFARRVTAAQKERERDETLSSVIDRVGLVLFFDRGAIEQTMAQERVLSLFEMNYPFTIRKIDVAENPDIAKRLGVGVLPDIWMIYRQDDDSPLWRRVKAGLSSEDELLAGIEYALQHIGADK
jgi:conjugal transfer pilus assembly protein TraF